MDTTQLHGMKFRQHSTYTHPAHRQRRADARKKYALTCHAMARKLVGKDWYCLSMRWLRNDRVSIGTRLYSHRTNQQTFLLLLGSLLGAA